MAPLASKLHLDVICTLLFIINKYNFFYFIFTLYIFYFRCLLVLLVQQQGISEDPLVRYSPQIPISDLQEKN